MRQHTQIVALGDSVTVGVGFSQVTASNGYVARLRQRFADARLDTQLTASALDGIDTGYAVRRFNRMVTAFEPDHVLVMLGLNDARPPGNRPATSPAAYRQNLFGLVDRILAIDARPLLASPNPRPGAKGIQLMRPYAEAVEEVAEHFQLGWADVFGSFLAAGNLRELVPDGTHPSAAGHALITEAIGECLLPLLTGQPQATPAEAAMVDVRK